MAPPAAGIRFGFTRSLLLILVGGIVGFVLMEIGGVISMDSSSGRTIVKLVHLQQGQSERQLVGQS
ncbi:hypothetical protein Cylst_6442 (plasmid) [Cylindrospermum stagnale PCC 7417]|uniref:Uncharacterized protein n=1 Tax=Cylindrospermum stagnale PCC 7417 TaxID=56107 RepID=K9X6W5_9NOST|nr:hypothetical protein Cylst_6442 [Cylindrospermum stagnale PCC 7417]